MRNSRRSFLKSFAACALLPTAISAKEQSKEQGLVGTQLYGWGQYYEREGKNFGEQMEEVLSAVRDCGYDHAEGSLNTANPEANAIFAGQLKSKGLKPVALYTGGRLHADPMKAIEQITRAAKVCSENGFTIINCNPDPIGRAKTDSELKTQAESLNTLGTELQKIGMKLGVHNHTPEMQNGAREFHNNFKATNPKMVGFCYDVHWVFRGGINPEEALKEYGDRVVAWHLRQSREGIWWEDLDKGDIDYNWISSYVKAHDLPRVFSVELALEAGTKITRSCVENHRRSREYIRQVFEL
jgi:inosose dehydratase